MENSETRQSFMFILTFDTYVRYPRESKLVFGGHVRRSRENVIAEKKRANRAGALFLLYARARGLTEKG